MKTKTAIAAAVLLLATLSLFAQLASGPRIEAGIHPVVADFNGDGLDDLIEVRTVFINDGSQFVRARELELQGSDGVVDVLDVNGDGRLDLLTVDNVSVAPPSVGGGYGFRHYKIYIADAAMGYPSAIAIPDSAPRIPYIADLDSDGRDDLVLLTALFQGVRDVGTRVEVLRSLGNGEFEPRGTQVIAHSPQLFLQAQHLASGDLNNDRNIDLAIRTMDELVVMTGRGDGSLNPATTRFLSSEVGNIGLRLADMDGDRNLDVVFADDSPWPTIRVLFNDGRAKFPRTAAARLTSRTARFNSPRTLATMKRGQSTEIAAGTDEGDIVIFGMQGSQLVELSRTSTGMLCVNLYAGSFREPDSSDLYASPTGVLPGVWPESQIYFGARYTPPGPVTQIVAPVGRRRSAGQGSVPPLLSLFDVQLDDSGPDLWQFTTEGMFAVDRNEHRVVEAVLDQYVIYLRLTRGSEEPLRATLLANGPNRFEGIARVGNRDVQIVAVRK